MRKYWKLVFWAVLFIAAAISLTIAIASRKTAIIASGISVGFTGGWLIYEIRKAIRKYYQLTGMEVSE